MWSHDVIGSLTPLFCPAEGSPECCKDKCHVMTCCSMQYSFEKPKSFIGVGSQFTRLQSSESTKNIARDRVIVAARDAFSFVGKLHYIHSGSTVTLII